MSFQAVELDEDPRRKEDYSAVEVEGSKVVFLPTSALTDLPRKPALKGHFDVVMVSQNLTQRLSADVMSLARNGALLIMETRKFLTTTSVKEKKDFADHLVQLATDLQCQSLQTVDGVNDYLAKFRLVRN